MKTIKVLGCPFSFGQPHFGVEKTPELLRELKLLDQLNAIAPVIDLGDLDFSLCHKFLPLETIKKSAQNSLANELISSCIEGEDLTQSFLLNLGGDHGMGLGTVHGLLAQNPDTVVVWADAHGDVNTPESSPSGNFHGMPLSFLMKVARDPVLFPWIKRTLLPSRLIMVGPRDLDQAERDIIEDLKISYFSSEEMNEFGARHLLKKALLEVDPEGRCPIHLSFDVDLFDSMDVISTGTRVESGPYMPEIFNLGKILGATGRLRSMDLVELNPKLGYDSDMRKTFLLAMEFTTFVVKHAMSGVELAENKRPSLASAELFLRNAAQTVDTDLVSRIDVR
jgi:arginase